MEDIDLDQVVEVPDTPDRLASRHNFHRDSVGNPDRMDEKYENVPRISGRFGSEDEHARRQVMRHPRNLNNLDIINSCSNSNVENSPACNNSRIFRRAAVGKSSSHEANHSTRTETMDKGKSLRIKVSSKSSPCNENNKVLDLTKQSDTQSPIKDFRHGEIEDLVAEDKRRGKVASVGSSANCIPSHSERSRNALKGKEKVDDSAFKGLGLAVALGKGVDMGTDPQHKMGQEKPVPLHSVTLPRVSGQKRLVRNGCISPHNIARSKQLAEQNNNSYKDFEKNHVGNVDSNGPQSVIDISDIFTEENNSERVKGKGKGIIIHSSTPKENNARSTGTSGSHLNDNEQPNGINGLGSDVNGGWRTTRNRSRQIEYIFPDSAEHLHRRINGVGNSINQHQNRLEGRDTRSQGSHRTEDDFVEYLNATQKSSGLVSELDRISGPHNAAKTVSKRQKKRGLNSENHAEGSTAVSGGPDIVILGSSEASENSKSSRIQRPQFQGTSSQVIEVDELSPAAGQSVPRGIDSMDDDSDARARQLEADEILARELQEQLYHEVPITGGGERIDEHLAWALQQQEENALNTSSRGSHNLSHRRGSTIFQSDRQPRPESFQNHSSRRGGQARAPYSRVAQLRARFRNQSPRVSTRGRNLQFPFDMALDMRMDILEALEAAVEDFSDVGLDSRMLRVQRDFNDNDYEMLLALDENNHQHAGATVLQINNLPQSTVQSDASAEACAICLETPTIGEIVRHLPCLHRFHKDCIDPWLGRRTSCPVCKCSVT